MVALIANAIEDNLKICDDLLSEGKSGVIDLKNSLIEIIGDSNELPEAFIQEERNPWLAEALNHLVLYLSTELTEIHPPGQIYVIGNVHDDPKDKGIDITALYHCQTIGLTISECKAYKLNPNKAISDASSYFLEIDGGGILGRRIRTRVQAMRNFLPENLRNQATNGFWKKERCFLPFLVFDATESKDWRRARPALNKLPTPPDRRIIIPIQIRDFDLFFNNLSNSMRNFAERLEHEFV